MKYSKLFNLKATPQSQPIPGSNQAPNNAGGYGWVVDEWAQLDRFLILGSDTGTYYVRPSQLTRENAEAVQRALKLDGRRVVERIVEVSEAGRAPKNDAAVFALALAASFGDDSTRALALASVPRVCRTGTHLFAFAAACDGLRGWGRGLRKAVATWYAEKSTDELAYQAVKYQQREGWAHRDLLRLAHPNPADAERGAIYKWIVDGEPVPNARLIEATLELRGMEDPAKAAALVAEHRIPREAVPTELLKDAAVWEALLADMPMTAMIRNLATMTRVGLIAPNSAATETVVARLQDVDRMRKARVHPIALLLAHATYASGRGMRGGGTWTPVKPIVDELDAAFYRSFASVNSTGKRFLLGIDVSGSMDCATVAGSPLKASAAAAAMAMVTINTEPKCRVMAFCNHLVNLPIKAGMRLHDVLKITSRMTFGSTDCALPMLYARRHRLRVDAFVVYTDNETWYGATHPAQALQQYRDRMGIAAKLIVVAMAGARFNIADPNDLGMLDVVGFDASVPQAMEAFVDN